MPERTEWTISVVVPVFNGEATIRTTIEHLLLQSLRPAEIIVVDDGSTDETSNVLKSIGDGITVLSKSNGGPASARNAGIRASKGNLIAFTDSDCFPNENWLKEIVRGFKRERVGGVGGRVRGASNGLIGDYIDLHGWMNPRREFDGTVLALVTANACFRRNVLFQTGLFDERFSSTGAEDTELSIRVRKAGYELRFVETAEVRHRHKKTIQSYCKSIANHGQGQAVLETLWSEQQTKPNRRRELFRSAFGILTMRRFYQSYRRNHGRSRSFLFALLDHCQYLSRIWGYRRGRRNLIQKRRATNDRACIVYAPEEVVD